MRFCIFLVLLSVTCAVYAVNEKVVVCYYGTWATYRWGLGKFDVDQVNPNLCTHLMYAFVGINTEGTVISLDPYLDLSENSGKSNFRKFNDLKLQNPNLKTILAVGGWNEGSGKYSRMAASSTLRRNFINSALKMIQDYGFDGLDLDWEYPNRRDTVFGKADIENFTQLIKELREEFDKYGLILTAAVAAVEETASLSYDVPAISKYLDYINLMTYDMYGAWDPVTGHNAPLDKGEGDDSVAKEKLFTVDNAVEYWLSAGCPPEKLVLGVPFYGRTFTLTNANIHSVRAPSKGAGISGPFTITNGFVGYNEFCNKLQTESWSVRRDELAKVPYAFRGTDWVSYDDPESMKAKVAYSLSLNLAGIMIWSIETDDFSNVCGAGEFPLLQAINDALDKDTSSSDSIGAPVTTTVASPETTTKAPSTTTTQSVTTDKPTSTTTTTPTTSTPTSTVTDGSDTTFCKQAGFAANPQDCSTYYMCVQDANGALFPIKFNCPASLFWDQNSLYCNYKDQVVCSVS